MNDTPRRAELERMLHALRHRGPDGAGIWQHDAVALGHARLSIIDLAGGQQPLFNEDRSVAVVCNGEIYNYRQLRERLIKQGHIFRTNSDCEVLAHLWEESGREMLSQLRGMFAFVIYDSHEKTLFGARDRFGQKPLYYHQTADQFVFGSELKAVLAATNVPRKVDPSAVDQFLFYQFVPAPRTLFSDLQALPAGHSFTLTTDAASGLLNFRTDRYWEPEFAPEETLSDDEHLERTYGWLLDAVEAHLVSDVPVGLFLSGGIDSSLIAALARQFTREPLQSFSITFPGSDHDEGPAAAAVAEHLGMRHTAVPFAPESLIDLFEQTAASFDQPIADAAVFPLWELSRHAARQVKVVLTGDGGDELFGGYRKYKRLASSPGNWGWLARWSQGLFPTRSLAACGPDHFGLRKMQARLATTLTPGRRSDYRRRGWEGWERHRLYQPEFASVIGSEFESWDVDLANHTTGLDPINAALYCDQGPVLADKLLLKTDRATMASGLEARAPFLDHELAAIAGRLPLHLIASRKQTKIALRELATRVLPAEIVGRRKKGFSLPLGDWFRHELKDWLVTRLVHESTTSNYFRRKTVVRLIHEHTTGHRNHTDRLHTLLALELWHREFLGSSCD